MPEEQEQQQLPVDNAQLEEQASGLVDEEGNHIPAQQESYTAEDLKGLLSALDKERENNRQKDRLLEERAKRDAIYKEIDPERYKSLEEADQRRAILEAESKARTEALEEQYLSRLRAKDEAIAELKKANIEKDKRSQLEKVFAAAKGRSGAGEQGVSFFDMFYQYVGSNFKFDDNGKLTVVDAQGNLVIDSETSDRIDPVRFIERNFKRDDVLGFVFEPEMGRGSGMLTPRGKGVSGQSLHEMSKKELYNIGFGPGSINK